MPLTVGCSQSWPEACRRVHDCNVLGEKGSLLMTVISNPEELVGAPLREATSSWTDRDVLLYHLGVGAGVPPSSPRELRYVYERDLTVLPSFASVAGSSGLHGFRSLPGLDLSQAVVLHAEHLIEVPGPIPVAAEVVHTGCLKDLVDRGAGALALFEIQTRDKMSGGLLMRNVAYFYVKGLGGFGKAADEPYQRLVLPPREPDRVGSVTLIPQQAFIYRLVGDRNPLHVDPEVAARAGFARPLLQGLCTYGVICKSIIDLMLDSDVEAVRQYRARFTGSVFPGETLQIALWRRGEEIVANVTTRERGETVLVGSATLR
jgi:acyl dehydratase